MRYKTKVYLERQFASSAFTRFVGANIDDASGWAEIELRDILRTAAKKLTITELKTLKNAFEGIDDNGMDLFRENGCTA